MYVVGFYDPRRLGEEGVIGHSKSSQKYLLFLRDAVPATRMKPTCDQLVEIAESQQKRINQLEKEVERLTKELRKYVNENTLSGSVPPYLKKLENTVNRFAKDDDNDEPPKDNPRNARPEHIDRMEHQSLKNPICPKCGGHARRRGA